LTGRSKGACGRGGHRWAGGVAESVGRRSDGIGGQEEWRHCSAGGVAGISLKMMILKFREYVTYLLQNIVLFIIV